MFVNCNLILCSDSDPKCSITYIPNVGTFYHSRPFSDTKDPPLSQSSQEPPSSISVTCSEISNKSSDISYQASSVVTPDVSAPPLDTRTPGHIAELQAVTSTVINLFEKVFNKEEKKKRNANKSMVKMEMEDIKQLSVIDGMLSYNGRIALTNKLSFVKTVKHVDCVDKREAIRDIIKEVTEHDDMYREVKLQRLIDEAKMETAQKRQRKIEDHKEAKRAKREIQKKD